MAEAIRKAVIDSSSVVVNTILADDTFTLDGFTLVPSDTAAIGDAFDPAAGTFAPPPVPLSERKAALSAAVDARRDAFLTGGFSPTTGPLAGHTLQTRDDTDKLNWLTSQAAYQAAVAAGQGAAKGATFRTADNATVVVSFGDGLTTLLAMAAWGSAVFGRSWTLKDAIAAATDAAALDAIDIAAGWPA